MTRSAGADPPHGAQGAATTRSDDRIAPGHSVDRSAYCGSITPVVWFSAMTRTHGPPVAGHGVFVGNPPMQDKSPFCSSQGFVAAARRIIRAGVLVFLGVARAGFLLEVLFMRLALLFASFGVLLPLSLCSCGSKAKARSVTVRSLAESFRVMPEAATRQYVGQLVSIPVKFGSPLVHLDDERVVIAMTEDRPHVVELRLRAPVGVVGPGSRSVVGTLKSCSSDGVDRGLGVSFLIVVEDCRLE